MRIGRPTYLVGRPIYLQATVKHTKTMAFCLLV